MQKRVETYINNEGRKVAGAEDHCVSSTAVGLLNGIAFYRDTAMHFCIAK